MTTHSDMLYDQAREAIQRVFSDTSVAPSETKRSLRALVEEIENLLETVPEGDDE